MPSTPRPGSTRELMINLWASVIGALLMGGTGLGLSYLFGWSGNGLAVAAAVSVIFGLLVTQLFLRTVVRFFSGLGLRYMRRHTGIVRTYPNLHECKTDMEADFKRARESSLLLQIGRYELGFGEPSYFSLPVKDKERGSKIRILWASDKSPFLSKERAKNLGYDYDEWVESLRQLEKRIELLRKSNPHVEIKDLQHDEPYLWRIFIFGDIAYVSPYLHLHDNHKTAIVYKLREGEDSLYTVFKKYFDYVWMKNDPTGSADPIQRWANWK